MFLTYYSNEQNYVSECCYAYSSSELDMSTIKYGGPSGLCGRCLDNCIFVLDDMGEPFDTKEEKYGER